MRMSRKLQGCSVRGRQRIESLAESRSPLTTADATARCFANTRSGQVTHCSVRCRQRMVAEATP
jgi:hypothetical protein